MKEADIKNMSVEDLKVQLADAKAQYTKLKLAHGISPVENPIQIRDMRRTIARLNTALTAKQQQ